MLSNAKSFALIKDVNNFKNNDGFKGSYVAIGRTIILLNSME